LPDRARRRPRVTPKGVGGTEVATRGLNIENGPGGLADGCDVPGTRWCSGGSKLRPNDRARIDVRCNKDSGGRDDGGTGRAEHCRVIGRSESPKVARGVSIDLCAINHPRLPEEQPVKPSWREAADRDQQLCLVRRHLEAIAAVHVQPGRLRIFGIGARERACILVAEVEIEPSAVGPTATAVV